jgi:hypothetical protein
MEHMSSWSMLAMLIHRVKTQITKKEKTQKDLLQAGREIGLEVNTEKT